MSALAPVDEDVLPARPEVERSLLGSLLIDGGLLTRVMEFLVPEDFSSEPHRLVYESCLSLADRHEGIDLLTIQSELDRRGRLARAGGPAFLSGLVDLVPDVENVESYARLVREASLRRQLIQQSRRTIREAVNAPDAEVALENAQRELVEIAKGSIKGGFQPLGRITEKNEEEIQKIHGRGTMLTGLPTGFNKLNSWTQGFQRTDLIVIAARPGMGKTSFALNIATYLTVHSPHVVGFFSLEMSAAQIGFRVQCSEARVSLQRLREGRLTKEEKKSLFFTTQQLRDAKLFVDDTAAITLLEMRARALQLKQRHGLDALFVDYLQIMGSRGRIENRTQEVSAFSRGLKALAKELEVPVVALSQLSRRPEQRGSSEKEPQLSDLRESGAIEQDADLVMFLYRAPAEKGAEAISTAGIVDLIIAKQRNGPTGKFQLGWSGEFTRFSELAQVAEGPF